MLQKWSIILLCVFNQVPFNFFCLTPDEKINNIAIQLKKI